MKKKRKLAGGAIAGTPRPNQERATEVAKKTFLAALEESLGVITSASRSTGLSRTQVYTWLKDDETLRISVAD